MTTLQFLPLELISVGIQDLIQLSHELSLWMSQDTSHSTYTILSPELPLLPQLLTHTDPSSSSPSQTMALPSWMLFTKYFESTHSSSLELPGPDPPIPSHFHPFPQRRSWNKVKVRYFEGFSLFPYDGTQTPKLCFQSPASSDSFLLFLPFCLPPSRH